MRRADALIGLGVVTLSGVLLWQTGRIPTPPFIPISPAFYPRIILAVLALLAAALVGEAWLAGPPGPAPAPPPRAARRWLVALCFLLFGLYTAALPWLGYRLSTALFVAATQWSLGARTLRTVPGCLAVGLGTALATYVVFERYLHVLLPRGSIVP
ncbi:MAG TPA: tripartite tricarboxylate transporter TctB family protein [Methylomirabilota bacterium]|nr:tripartite tricarboxylate transporter TctB family protein [Methylomirabilota bacterium]